jgi:Luciferase-like monooxygenase
VLFGQVVDDALNLGPAAVPVSVLDLAPVPEGGNAGDALRATIDLARQAERLGFRRFWVAEHHNMPGIASSAPAVLIGHITTMVFDPADRLRSFEPVAALARQPAAATPPA